MVYFAIDVTKMYLLIWLFGNQILVPNSLQSVSRYSISCWLQKIAGPGGKDKYTIYECSWVYMLKYTHKIYFDTFLPKFFGL